MLQGNQAVFVETRLVQMSLVDNLMHNSRLYTRNFTLFLEVPGHTFERLPVWQYMCRCAQEAKMNLRTRQAFGAGKGGGGEAIAGRCSKLGKAGYTTNTDFTLGPHF